jgi:PHD/YefM family antitoxin component YafN of YafNO toxin-antitoxin module
MFNVHVKPADEIKARYTEFAGMLKEHDRIIITNEGKQEAVIIGMEDYADYEAYAHNQYVQKKLAEAEALAAKADAVWINEEDFWREDEAE